MRTNSDSSVNHSVQFRDPFVEFRNTTRSWDNLNTIESIAQEELANFFSCLKCSLSSHRPDYMKDCATEFMSSIVAKMNLASSIAVPVVQQMHEPSGILREVRADGTSF